MNRLLVALLAAAMAVCAGGCFIFHRVEVQQVIPRDAVVVTSPVKAHLKDGSNVVYANGVSISGGSLRGVGVRYDLALKRSGEADNVPLDSVVGMESFRTEVDRAKTAVVSTLVTAVSISAGIVLLKAIFGSCPTVYSSDGAVQEAELFSNSIAPLFEARDVDRLKAQPDGGVLRLEIRNEAMETHYINHLQIFEVQHDAGDFVLPDTQGHPVVVQGVRTPDDIASRGGENLQALLSTADGSFYRTERSRLDGAAVDDLNDWIDLTVPVSDGADSATLVFRLRNSLLNTTLLYDVMLGPAGARSIDWLGSGLSRISSAVELGRWHERLSGMHILVWREGAYREAVRVPDSGPITWHDVAAEVPAQKGEKSLRIRLSFLADQWRIDQVGVASKMRRPAPRIIPLSRVTGTGNRPEIAARENMGASDDRYLETGPGARFLADFDIGIAGDSKPRTFLLSSQGYYTEWIRGSWIQSASAKEPFQPTGQAILAAMQRWGATREAFEARFFQDRVPVN
ncbi:MAG: hypothetical protein ABI822_05565 [Bryobacteraceae bacterium]